MINVLHLVAGDLSGGAARGAYWLHKAQREIGIDSHILTSGRESGGDPFVTALGIEPFQRLTSAIRNRAGNLPIQFYRNRQGKIFNTGFAGIDFTKRPEYHQADLVHLHWINGLVATRTLRKVDKPIVWTLRDMWPLTGGCHYSMECDGYKRGCGACPQLGSKRQVDLSQFVVRHKRRLLPKKIQVAGISRWLSECASQSKVFGDFNVTTISNNIDTNQFLPIDPSIARQVLGLPADKKIVLVGAQRITDFYKGFDLYLEAMQHLRNKDVHMLTFGREHGIAIDSMGFQHTHLGFLADTVSLRLAYSAADVFVAPSRMDAFGKTLAEAMACGTPVVCFDATGPKDIVDHRVTGCKAAPFKPEDLAAGIDEVLGLSSDDYKNMRIAARERAVRLFDSRVIARQYLGLYQDCLAA